LSGVHRLSRSRRRVALLALLVAAWVLGTALGTVAPARRASASILLRLEPTRVGYFPSLDGSQPIFILFLGSDARPGESIIGERSDSVHLVAINPAKHKATIVGFPRDSWVPIPGHGTSKINSAMVEGGPALTVQTVEQLMGIHIDYWALTWFDGFSQMVDDVGGLIVDVPFAMHDHYSHASFDPGRQTLSGRQALAFARDRHSLPTGDFGRSEDQGRLMLAALAQFGSEFTKDPSRIFTWIGAGLRNVRTEVPLDQVLNLAFTAAQINPKHVANAVLPGGTGMVGAESVVNLDQTTLAAIAADLKPDGILKKANVPPSPNASLLGG
jgi:LCP family protein required for cell wall assembly